MTWYFLHEGKPVGPTDVSLMRRLQQSGRIGPGTMVWRQGMAQWQPWAQVQLTLAPAAGTAPATSAGTGDNATAGDIGIAASDTEVCCQCGRTCPQGDVLIFGEKPVCAPCKPFFLERIREGVLVIAGDIGTAFAGFWTRAAAFTMDLALVLLCLFALTYSLGPFGPAEYDDTVADITHLWSPFTTVLVWMGYVTLTTAWFSATPGKLVLGLRVITADGRSMTFGLSVARTLATLLSAAALGFGFFLALFDNQKRTLHDGMCDTRVVRNAFVPYKVL